ncbi:hypothetical protein F6J85_01815 [Microbacterium lushaniae]|uniref:DUF2867 domain-containing protein n=1 Tax=Microbacterium lushaniae TaxID=2614639 RepID=A0A5J6L8K4_9MICO|nr:hypothetical protein F6J85_01815 [Microbacterium lushaniae]
MWEALIQSIPAALALPSPYLRLIGADPGAPVGAIPAVGSAVPGFAVTDVVPSRSLTLAGHHHFSRYELRLTVERAPAGALLSAHTSAEFPGFLGWGYRLLVIRSGAHRVITRRFLEGIARRAARPPRA